MEEYYKTAVEGYKKVNSNIDNKIVSLSLTVIGAIYVLSEKYSIGIFLVCSLLGFVLTIVVNLLSNFLGSKHYERFLDEKIHKIDFRESNWGIWTERLFYVYGILFLISAVLFIIALIQIIVKIK